MLFYKCLCNIYIYIHMTLLKLYILWGQSTARIPVHPWSGLWNATSTVIYWKKNIIQQCYRLEPNIVYLYYIVAYNYSVVYIYIYRFDLILSQIIWANHSFCPIHPHRAVQAVGNAPEATVLVEGDETWWNHDWDHAMGPCNGGVFDNVWNGGWLISLFQLMVQ